MGGFTRQRAISAVVALAAVAMVVVAVTQSQQPQPQELDQVATVVGGCLRPPCDVSGVPAPEVHYQFEQPAMQPHPLVSEAVQRAADALAESQKTSDKEMANAREISGTLKTLRAIKAENKMQVDQSNSGLWAAIGQLKSSLGGYKRRIGALKAQMKSRDNYLSARASSLTQGLGRAKVPCPHHPPSFPPCLTATAAPPSASRSPRLNLETSSAGWPCAGGGRHEGSPRHA